MKKICLGILFAISFTKASFADQSDHTQFSESDFNVVYNLDIDPRKLDETPCPHEILRKPDSLEFILVLYDKSKVRLGVTADGGHNDSRLVWERVKAYGRRGGIDVFQMSNVRILISKNLAIQKVSEAYRGQFLLNDSKSNVGSKLSIQITGPNSLQYEAESYRMGGRTKDFDLSSADLLGGRVFISTKCTYRK